MFHSFANDRSNGIYFSNSTFFPRHRILMKALILLVVFSKTFSFNLLHRSNKYSFMKYQSLISTNKSKIAHFSLRGNCIMPLFHSSTTDERNIDISIDKIDEHHNISPVTLITSPEHFLSYLSEDSERITIVRFHAKWCRACNAFDKRFQKLIKKAGDTYSKDGSVISQGLVRFADIDYEANKDLCRALEIDRFPAVNFYKSLDPGLLETLVCESRLFKSVVDTLNRLTVKENDAAVELLSDDDEPIMNIEECAF